MVCFRDQLAKYNVVIPEGYVPPRGRLPVRSGPLLPSGRSFTGSPPSITVAPGIVEP